MWAEMNLRMQDRRSDAAGLQAHLYSLTGSFQHKIVGTSRSDSPGISLIYLSLGLICAIWGA
jgi:hypothetical protein